MPDAQTLHERGYRVARSGGESTDYYKLTAPSGTVREFQDRFDEPTGIDNSVLGFKQVKGPPPNFIVTPPLLKQLAAVP